MFLCAGAYPLAHADLRACWLVPDTVARLAALLKEESVRSDIDAINVFRRAVVAALDRLQWVVCPPRSMADVATPGRIVWAVRALGACLL